MNNNTKTEPISDSLSRFYLTANPTNRGFTMTFENRITVSIRWGDSNYSDGKTTAECAAWNADTHEWVHIDEFDYNGDDVLPRLTTDQVARFMYVAANMARKF